jgi:hypothetical protein
MNPATFLEREKGFEPSTPALARRCEAVPRWFGLVRWLPRLGIHWLERRGGFRALRSNPPPAAMLAPKEPQRSRASALPALLALALALPGCAGFLRSTQDTPWPLLCISRCGARLYAQPGVYQGTCEDFDAAEARVVGSFVHFEPNACDRLFGVLVAVQPTASWQIDTRHVAGVTRCNRRGIQIGSVPWTKGAYAHEVVHLLQCPAEDIEHSSWSPGIWAAIDAANSVGVVP